MSKVKEALKKIDKFIEDIKEKYTDIFENIDSISKEVEIFFMQNMNEYDIYTLRFAILELSKKYSDEEKEIESEFLFHISMIFSYIKENLHPVELYEEGVIYNDIYVQFLFSLTENFVNTEYPLAVDYVDDILTRTGFLKNFLEDGDILTRGILFYKSVEGKILDFCFNKVLFNKTPIVVKKFVKFKDEDKIIFNKKFVKELYRAFYDALETKFGDLKTKKKHKFTSKIFDKEVIKLQKYIQKLVDEKELKYMLSVGEDNTENIYISYLPDIIEQLKNIQGGAVKIAVGLGIDNADFLSIVLKEIPTDRFLEDLSHFILNYKNQNKLSLSLILVLNGFIRKFALETPFITDNPENIELYDNLMEKFKELIDALKETHTKEVINSDLELIFKGTEYLYFFRKFEFEKADEIFKDVLKTYRNNLYLKTVNLINGFLLGKLDKEKLSKELDKIFNNIISELKEEDEDLDIFTLLNLGGYIKMLKYILTGEEEQSDIYKIIKAYIENDRDRFKNLLEKIYSDSDTEDMSLEEFIQSFDMILELAAYRVLQFYPFDKRIYQLYNPNYSYKTPEIKDGKVVWV